MMLSELIIMADNLLRYLTFHERSAVNHDIEANMSLVDTFFIDRAVNALRVKR